MGMGYGVNYVDTVKDSFVKKNCPKEWKALMIALETSEEGLDLESLAIAIYHDEADDKNVMIALENLQDSFEQKTGLSLTLGFHDVVECGDRYDEVNGSYWIVNGVYQYTPAGKKYKDKIDRKMFVTFG